MTINRAVRLLSLALIATCPAIASAETVRVTGSRLNIRSEATVDGPVLAVVSRGDILEASSLEGDWYAVRVPGSERVGYVHRSFVERTDAVAPRPAAPARTAPRFTIAASYVLGSGSVDISGTTSFSLYGEESGRLTEAYSFDSSSGFDVGARALVVGSFGLEASYTVGKRSGTTEMSLRLPHPLYLDEPRTVTPTTADPEIEENAFHLGIVAIADLGRVRAGGYGGASFYSVTADLLREVTFTQTYPYEVEDTTITGAPLASISESSVGFHVGGFADVILHPNVGIGIDARFTRATVELQRPSPEASTEPDDPTAPRPVVPDTGALELQVGGLQILGGLRLYF